MAQPGVSKTPIQPPSSIPVPGSAGKLANTHLLVLATSADFGVKPQVSGPPFPGYLYQTPASVACIYHFAPTTAGCNPNIVSTNPSGGSKAIAIVDAYDDPNAYADLQFFSTQFGLTPITPATFQVVYAPPGGSPPGSCTGSATQPPSAMNTGWDVEESLDIEWSHAMAPGATIYLVEAQSSSNSDLFCAVSVASTLVSAAGGGEVSMSWGGGEFPSETTYDAVFTTPKVVYFASSGDNPGVYYPSASPNVVSVGGTSVSYDANNGAFIGENTWQSSGGGASAYESRPSYQASVSFIVGSQRGVPDVSSDGNPYTGVWVWDSLEGPYWYTVGGTSVSSPTWAGIVNTAGTFAASSNAELSKLYADLSGGLGFGYLTDIVLGDCGPYVG
ncbi:MAG: hypothetical protein ABSH09_35200, partial [Bryobacteraceae bacterium]